MSKTLIAPSLLASDFGNFQQTTELLNGSEADWLHLDVMDGSFVPNISFGAGVVNAIASKSNKFIDVHLMIVNPEKYIMDFAKAGAHLITIHLEACTHLQRTLTEIKNLGCKTGVALNPHTPIELLSEVMEDIDIICIMSVNPGFGGQKLIPNTFKKLRKLREYLDQFANKPLIQVDGGVNAENSRELVEAGADILVAGNFLFSKPNLVESIAEFKAMLS